jgi:hypothetical protein
LVINFVLVNIGIIGLIIWMVIVGRGGGLFINLVILIRENMTGFFLRVNVITFFICKIIYVLIKFIR